MVEIQARETRFIKKRCAVASGFSSTGPQCHALMPARYIEWFVLIYFKNISMVQFW